MGEIGNPSINLGFGKKPKVMGEIGNPSINLKNVVITFANLK